MKLTIRMRITLLTGVIIIIASALLTFTSIYNAENKIWQVVNQVAEVTVAMQAIPLEKSTPSEESAKGEKAVAMKPATRMDEDSKAHNTVDMEMLTAAYATPAKAATKEFNYISLGIMITVTIVGMLSAYYLAGKALKPVHNLNIAISNISKENLKERLQENSKADEISDLTHSFNAMLDRLEDAFWRQKRFSSNVAHELKTPLAVMKTGMQVLDITGEATTEEYKEVMSITTKNIDRLTNLVNDLLILTNESNEVETKTIQLNDLILDITGELRSISKSKPVSIEILEDDKKVFVRGNETLTYRLFYNLIENAIKYNIPQGEIKIKIFDMLEEEKNYCCISIEDTGMGIEEEELKKIFQPFYCVDSSRSRRLGGAGLGLSIVKDIAEKSDWEIKVESKSGEGTKFTVKMQGCCEPVLLDL